MAASQGHEIAIKALDSIIEKQAETTENYNSQSAAELYQLITAERQRREKPNQGSRISSNEMSENAPEEIQATTAIITKPVADLNKKYINDKWPDYSVRSND